MFWTQGKFMPGPACTRDGKCKECGCDENGSHKGTCAWSLMRSGEFWIPKKWFEQTVESTTLPAPGPCLVDLHFTGIRVITKKRREKEWLKARNCPQGCGSICKKLDKNE